MSFPADPRPMLFELQVGSTDWANITDDVFSLRTATDIDWGVPGEYTQSDPSTCTFWLNNRAGRYSPRNPLSPLYGMIGKNTPVRVSIGEGAKGLVTRDGGNGSAWASDTVATSITGDIDIRVDLEILAGSTRTWAAGSFDLASKYENNDAQRSWTLAMTGGQIRFTWWPLGTVASQRSVLSSTTVGGSATGRKAIRVTMDANNNFGAADIEFWTAPSLAGPWTKVGTTVTQSPTTSIFDGTAGTRIGAAASPGATPAASYYGAEIYNGIGGTLVAAPDFASQPLDPVPFAPSAFTDSKGNTWTPIGSADAARVWYGNVDIRFWGETSSFPNRWDVSNKDAWVPIEAADILRRLGRGSDPAQTGLRAWIESQNPAPVSYFPLSGEEGTQYSINQGSIGRNSFRFYPESQGATNPVFTYGKDFGAPYLGNAMELNATGSTADMRADVGAGYDNFTLDFVFQSPELVTDAGVTLNTNMGVLDLFVWTYDYDRWQLRLNDPSNNGTLQVSWFAGDDAGTFTFPASATWAPLLDNEIHTVRFQVRSIVGGQAYTVWIDGVAIQSNSLSTPRPINGTSLYQMYYSRYAGQTVVNLGHLTAWADVGITAPAVGDFLTAARGYTGELAGDRMVRIAGLAGIPMSIVGNTADTMPMGPQYSEGRLTQLRDAEAADMGILATPRDAFGLQYRTRVSMVNQTPALTLSYASGHIVAPFEPTDDDMLTKNDITAVRRDGDSRRVQLTTGKLSVQEPPFGVGQYHDEVQVNVETDGLLEGIASWLVNLGTVDQARYPSVTVDLGNLVAAGLDKAARSVKFGDLLVITDMDALGVFEDVRLLVLGGHETISEGGFKHTITWNCAPYAGYEGGVYATDASTGTARYDTNGSQLAASLTTTATTFQVNATGGTLWTTDPAAFPFDVMMDGERMTVGAISGTSSPQTFSSVTRSVNGVVKTHNAGADIRLANPTYYSL